MLGKVNTRKIDKYEYEITGNAIVNNSLSAASPNTMTSIVPLGGGGKY